MRAQSLYDFWLHRVGRVLMSMGLLLGFLLYQPSPAIAALKCKTIDQHQVCLESVKRSAKYFWEYRAVVSVDDQPQPEKRYDCRQGSNPVTDDSLKAVPEAEIQRFICQLVQG